MKKIILIVLLAVSLVSNTRAQYFQHIYGTPDNEFLMSGINTQVQPLGHFMVGSKMNTTLPYNSLNVVFADASGNIPGPPYFENRYNLLNLGLMPVHTASAYAFEMDNAAGFGIVGSYINGTINSGIYYSQLDPMGNPIAAFDYTPLAGIYTWQSVSVANIAESVTGNELYVTGTVVAAGTFAPTFAYVIKINVVTGALIWSQVYDIVQSGGGTAIELGVDVIESPYTPLGNPEVILVGNEFEDPLTIGNTYDGFLLRIDANTGLLSFPWATIFGSPTSWDVFSSITVSNSTAGGNVGFVIGGTSQYNGNDDYWLVKTDPTCGSSLWATLHDYSSIPGAPNSCLDVIERLNTNNQYEYYMGGYTIPGSIGNVDALVIKTNDVGNGVTNGEFTYGTANSEDCRRLDQYNNNGVDGLSVFGNSSGIIGGSEFYLVKSYFSGQSYDVGQCNELLKDPVPSPGPGLYLEKYVNTHSSFTSALMGIDYIDPLTDIELCYTDAVPGGSNARVAPAKPKNNAQATISPNPMTQGVSSAQIELQADNTENVDVAIYDMLGRQYYFNNHVLTKGTNLLPVNLSNISMATGMYAIKITGNDLQKTILLILK